MPEIDMDELGQPYAGPYDTAEEAAEAHPEAA
jgi:hypothetical protein